jgi:hypothetical protein
MSHNPNHIELNIESPGIHGEIVLAVQRIKNFAAAIGLQQPWSINGLQHGEAEPMTDSAPHFPYTSKEQFDEVMEAKQTALRLTMENRCLKEKLSNRRKEVKNLQKCLHRSNLIIFAQRVKRGASTNQ